MQKIDSSPVANLPAFAVQTAAPTEPAPQQAPPADAFEGAPRRQWAFAGADRGLAAPRVARDPQGRGHDGCCELLLCSVGIEAICLLCC